MGINKSRRSTFRKVNGSFARSQYKIRKSSSGLNPLNSGDPESREESYDPADFLTARERRYWNRLPYHRKRYFLKEAERTLRKKEQKKGIAITRDSVEASDEGQKQGETPQASWHGEERKRKENLLRRQKNQSIRQIPVPLRDQKQGIRSQSRPELRDSREQSPGPFLVGEKLGKELKEEQGKERRRKQYGVLAERAVPKTEQKGNPAQTRCGNAQSYQTYSARYEDPETDSSETRQNSVHAPGKEPWNGTSGNPTRYPASQKSPSGSEDTEESLREEDFSAEPWQPENTRIVAVPADTGSATPNISDVDTTTGGEPALKEAAGQAVKESAGSHVSLKAAQETAKLFKKAVRKQKEMTEQKEKKGRQESLGDFERSGRSVTFLAAEVITSVIATFQTMVSQVASALVALLIPILICSLIISFVPSFLSGIVGSLDQPEVQAGTGGNIVAVAIDQIGYKEGPKQDTKYGKFTNTNHMNWCHAFIAWCANECGYIDDGVIPKTALCEEGHQWFVSHNEWQANDSSYVPQPGDIIYLDFHGEGASHHAGIVEYSEKGIVHTIEGNKRNKVMRGKYPVGYAKIMGYGQPAYPEEGYEDYGTGQDYLNKVKEMGEAIVSEKWIYSNQNVSRSFHGAESGNNRKTNCAHAISMSMQLFGTLKKGQTFHTDDGGRIVANSAIRKQIEKNYDIIKVDGKRNAQGVDLKPGDICLWNAHVSVFVGKTKSGKNKWYDFSHKSTTNKKGPGGTYIRYDRYGNPGQTLYQILRLKDAQSYGSGKKTVVPKPYGTKYSYMGWDTLHTPGTPQMHLKDRTGEHYDSHGFAKVGERYVIACTTTFGQVGDEMDIVLENGNVIHAVMGDEKSQKDSWCNKWGHSLDETAEHAGEVVVEFVVNKGQWYGIRDNPYITQTHPEWKSRVNFIMNLGKNDIPKS